MEGIVLAAGCGRRMAPYTDDRPKSLLELGGYSLISYTLTNFKNAGLDIITVITGYKHHLFRFSDVNYIHNPDFAQTNMVYTLFCAEHLMNRDLVISYGDIIFNSTILEKLLLDPADIAVVLDDDWRRLWELRNENPLKDAETLIVDDSDHIKEIGDRALSYHRIESQYIGLLKFTKQGSTVIRSFYNNLKSRDSKKPILRNRCFKNLHLTDLLQLMIEDGIKIKGVRVNGGWLEVDTVSDYELYQELHRQGHLCPSLFNCSVAQCN
jgi:choline kinase